MVNIKNPWAASKSSWFDGVKEWEKEFKSATKTYRKKLDKVFEEAILKSDIKLNLDMFIEMIYYLRDKNNYKTYRESFFDKGDVEFISSIRSDKDEDLNINPGRKKVFKFLKQLNNSFSTYGIDNILRKAHFLGQSYLETASFRATYEGKTTVPANYIGGVDFQGRGIKQITHDYNYLAYYDYIKNTDYFEKYMDNRDGYESVGQFISSNKDGVAASKGMTNEFYNDELKEFAKKLSTELFHAIDSAFWFSTIYKSNVLKYMDEDNVEKVTKQINGGTIGLDNRRKYTKQIKEFLIEKVKQKLKEEAEKKSKIEKKLKEEAIQKIKK